MWLLFEVGFPSLQSTLPQTMVNKKYVIFRNVVVFCVDLSYNHHLCQWYWQLCPSFNFWSFLSSLNTFTWYSKKGKSKWTLGINNRCFLQQWIRPAHHWGGILAHSSCQRSLIGPHLSTVGTAEIFSCSHLHARLCINQSRREPHKSHVRSDILEVTGNVGSWCRAAKS